MEAIEMIKERRSVRKYTQEIVSKELMDEIIDAARWAPSWANFQIARYTVIQDKEIINRIAQEGVHGFAYNIGTLVEAKGVVVLSYVKGKSGKLSQDNYATNKADSWEVFDAGIACQTFCLAAHAKGVGTCIFGVIDDKVISDIISLPKEETVASVITFGFPNEVAKVTPRFEVDEVVRYM